jgi:hypothetical protein
MPVFKTGALNHSATLPLGKSYIGPSEDFRKSFDWQVATPILVGSVLPQHRFQKWAILSRERQ